MSGRFSGKGNARTNTYLIIAIIVCALILAALLIFVSVADFGKPTEGTSTPSSSDNASTPSSSVTTSPTQGNPTPEEVTALIEKADFIAAGYDYQKAISMLQAFPNYSDYPILAEKVAAYQEADSKLVVYKDNRNITHIFFHSLIADTDRCFDGDSDAASYNLYMTTVDEFNAILEQMYERGYVLISPYDMAHEVTDETGTHFAYGKIRLPEGKIPFMMSQDDLNYYSYMIGSIDGRYEVPEFVTENCDGFAHKIVIGEDGYPTCEYLDKDGNIVTGDYDLVPLLERFIQKHPDFSYHGARAMLGVTGFEGVLGYRTKPKFEAAMGSEAYAKEVADAKAVAQCLKDHGWLIVSHSWGHPAYGNISADRVERDSDRWEEDVQPIVGDTDIILFPHGSDIHTWHQYPADNAKFAALYKDGYRYFFNVDGNTWNQLGPNYFRGGRRNLDGYRMYHEPELLEDLFDVATVFDPKRPTPVPTIN